MKASQMETQKDSEESGQLRASKKPKICNSHGMNEKEAMSGK